MNSKSLQKTKPTTCRQKELKYKQYIVTFIDVMGFKNLVEKRYSGNAAPIKKKDR